MSANYGITDSSRWPSNTTLQRLDWDPTHFPPLSLAIEQILLSPLLRVLPLNPAPPPGPSGRPELGALVSLLPVSLPDCELSDSRGSGSSTDKKWPKQNSKGNSTGLPPHELTARQRGACPVFSSIFAVSSLAASIFATDISTAEPGCHKATLP